MYHCNSCKDEYVSETDHTCKTCSGPKCNCDCPPVVIEEKEIAVSFSIKVKIHDYMGTREWDHFSSIEDAVKAWDFGNPRTGAHHWDTEYCHVSQLPDGRWVLLYL